MNYHDDNLRTTAEALRAAEAYREATRATMKAATDAADRADALNEAAQSRVDALARSLGELQAARANDLADRIAAGIDEQQPPTLDDISPRLIDARTHLAITSGAAQALRAKHAAAVGEMHRANGVEAAAKKAHEDVENSVEAAGIKAEWAALQSRVARLRARTYFDEFNHPLNVPARLHPAIVIEAQNIIPPRDALHVPVNELRGGGAEAKLTVAA